MPRVSLHSDKTFDHFVALQPETEMRLYVMNLHKTAHNTEAEGTNVYIFQHYLQKNMLVNEIF